jgi:hypothetical protein
VSIGVAISLVEYRLSFEEVRGVAEVSHITLFYVNNNFVIILLARIPLFILLKKFLYETTQVPRNHLGNSERNGTGRLFE